MSKPKKNFWKSHRRNGRVFHGIKDEPGAIDLLGLLNLDNKGLLGPANFYGPPRPLYETHLTAGKPMPIVNLTMSFMVVGLLVGMIGRRRNGG